MPGLTDLLRNPRRLRQFAETPGNYPAALDYATQDQSKGRVGRRPASRANSSEKEPNKLATGDYIDQVELPDGSVVRPATESGKLVKAPGKSNLYLDPATGEPYHADPSQATGLRSAWNTARKVKRDGKVYATISGVGEREIGDDPKAAEDAAKAEAKRAAENRRLELAREKRPYNIDRVTGEPVPLQTDEQWAAIKQAKIAKLDESARVKRLKTQADVIDLEADRVTLNAPKPAKEDEEAFNAAEAALMPHAAGQDLEQVAKKYAAAPATDETSQQAKTAAENYLAYKDKVKPARDAEKKVKELKLRAIDIKEQILDPQKWKEGKTASIAGLPDDDLVAEAKAQADIITEQEGQAVGTLDQITQGRNKIVKDLNDFTAARQRQASVGLSVEEQQAADHTQAQMEQSLAEYDDWHSEAKAEADASLKAAADRRDVLKVASTEIEARTAKQKESAAASKAKMETLVKAKSLYKDWAGGASGLYVEDWRTEEETPRFKQEAAKAGLSMPEAKEALQTYRQLDWSNGRRDPKTANEIHEDARLLPNGEITVNPMHLLDPEAYNAAADAMETTPEAKARAKAMRADLAVPVAEEAYKNLRKNSDFAAWLDANTTGTPLQRMEKFNAEMKSGGALNASLMKFLGSAASLPSGWLGTIAGLTGSDKALEYARYWQDRSQAYGTAAGEAGKGTNMAGRFMASVAGGVPSVMESMAAGGVARRIIGSGLAALGVAAVDAAAQSGGGTFVDAVDAYIAQGLSPEEAKAKAAAPALASGLATGVLTAIGGGGVESLLRIEGRELAKAAIKRGLKTMVAREVIEGVGEESLEEFSDQLIQGVIAQASYDPNKSLDQIMSEAIEAGLVGGVLGGGASGIHAYLGGKDADQTGGAPPTPGSPAPMPVQPRPAGPAPTPTPQTPQTPQDVADQVAKFNPTGATPLPQSVAATAKRTGRPPEAVARQAASGIVKLAQGQSIESLDIEEQEALGFVNKDGKIVAADNKVTPLVYDYKGKPIIRNAAGEWLTDEAQEELAGMVKLTEAERKAQIDAEEAAAKAKPAKQARPAIIEDWDWIEKGKQRRRATDEWFEEGMANPEVNAAFDRAITNGGTNLATHGMAKFGTLSAAYDALMGLLNNNVDPNRGKKGSVGPGGLDTAPLVVEKGSAASMAGTTGGGTSYRDGPFILVQSAEASKLGQGIKDMATVQAVLVNDANAGQIDAIRKAIHKIRPDMIVELYSKADEVARQLNQPANKKAGQPAPAKTESTPQVSGAVTTGGSLPSAAGSSPAPASTPAAATTTTPVNEPKPQSTVSQEPPSRQDMPKPRDVSVLPEQPATPTQQAPAGPEPAVEGAKPKHSIGKGSVIFSDVYRSDGGGEITLDGDPVWDAEQKEWMYPGTTKGGRSIRVAERFVTKIISTPTAAPAPTPAPAPTVSQPAAEEPTLTPAQVDQLARAQADYENRKAAIQKMEKDPERRGKQLYAEGMRFAAIKRQITGKLTGKEAEAKAKREASNYEGKPVSVDGKNATVVGTAFGKVKVKFEDGTTSSVAADKINTPVKPATKKPSPPAPASQEAKPAPSTPQSRMETALDEYEASVRQTLVGTPNKATKDLTARKLDLAKRLRARLKAMTGAVEYDVYAKELREGRGELEVKPVGEKDSILFVNPEKLIDRLAGKHKTTEAAREALDAFILHEFIHKAAIANMDSAKIIGLYNLLTPEAKAASKALYLSDSGLTDFWHKSAAANEFAAAHEWFAQLIEARLRGKISNQAEIEASKDPAFRDKLMALLKDFVAQLRDIAKLVTDKTQASRIEAEADAVQAIVADMAAKAGLELGQQAKPPSQAAVAPEVAPEAAAPQRDAVDKELAKAFDGLAAPPSTQPVEQVALPKERREAMLKAAGNIVDLGLTEPTDLAARLDKLAPNGSLRKYARSFWRLMTGFNADLQESPDWQAVFDSIDAATQSVEDAVADANVTPPQAAAIAKEEAMPESAKQAAPFDPVAAKGQKKYLLTEVAAAVKAAPRRSEMPEDVRDALNEIDEITAKFANQERRPLTADESAELSSQVKKLSAKVREAVGTITIEVPGDGTFTILNEKGALALFQKRADKFPTTQSKDDMPAKPTAQSPTAVPAIKKPKTTADVVAAIYSMVSTDTTRDTLTTVKGDGTNLWATNGRILVRVEQENGGGKGADNVSYDEKGNAQPWPVEKGNYNGEAIIPEDRKVPVHTIDTGRWFSIMSQARAVIKVLPSDKSEYNNTKSVSIYQNPDGSLGAFTSDAERGDYVHNIQPDAKFLASYDPEYFQTILRVARNLGNEQIELRIADDISPATLRTSNATFVIMPMRVNGAAAYSPKAKAARPTPPVTTQPTPAPTPASAPEPAPAKVGQTPAPVSPVKEGIDDFGEKLGGARKDKVATVNQTLTDDEIAGKTLSEIWPKSEIASIEDDELAAYATTLRSIIPSKPQKGYKLNAWVGKVKMVKQLMRFAEDRGVPEMLTMMRGPEYNLGVLADRVAFLQGLPREHWDRVGEVRNYPNAYRFGEGADSSKKIPAPYADANVDGYRVRADNLDDLMEAVKAKLAKDKPVAKMEFEVRGKTGAWGINKKGDPHYRKLKTFADSKEALAYRDSNYDNLVKAWEDVKERDNVKETDLRTDTNRPRSAEDWRKGKDATSQMFNDAFGFRGVEFGNWVSQGKNAAERQGMMNDAYDALHDLASILNIPTKALSLNGQIGLGFGSRGQGWASAHYEPGSLVINLTKTRGAGTLAHELFHAFDHYFGRARGVAIKNNAGVYITNEPATRYVNQKTGQALSVKRWNEIKKGFSSSINEADWKLQEGVRPEVEDAFEAVVKALDASPMAQRARMNDKGQRDYWGSTIERAARAFENYVIHKMQQKGYQNDYLANVVRIEDFVRNPNRYPYLLDNEIEPVAKAFDDLFSTIKSRETDKGVELYAPPSQSSVGQAVNEAFVKKVQDSVKAGRPVGTSNPTTASKTGEGTDSGHNVELDRLRKNNPLAYRQNALILTRYPVVAKKYRALHAAMAKADAPVIAAKEEVKKAKAALAAAQKGIKDRVALLRGMKTAQVRASLVNEFIAANLTARAVKAKDVAHANLAKANAKAAKAADYQSKAISEILDGNAIPEDVAAQIYEDYITAVESNLLALIELFPKRLRDVARLWYDGANIIAQKFGEQYNATLEQASGVLAVFSPQKDWFMNVSLAQRMMNIWANDQETVWSPEMTKQFIMRSGEPQPVESIKKGDTEPTISTRESLITDANPEGIVYQHGAIKKVDDDGNTYWENWDNQKAAENLKAAQLMLKDLEGKTLSQIKDRKLKARFIRILSEVRDSSAYPIVTPDGRTGAMQVNNDKVTLSKVAWGGYNTIEKAISIMERSVTIKGRTITDEHEVISIALGDQHKVRSFYNNIVDPANKSGHVTMDTHAIAAIHWMPHSGSSLEVTQNFGGGGVKNDGIAGIKGTYAANAEAYRRAAKEFKLLPREVQSITWEAVRLLFPKEFKTKGNIDKVRAIWNRYFHGDIDIETARAEIFALATTSKDFPQGKNIAGSIKDGKGLGDTAWAAAMGVGIDHPGGPEGTDDSGTVPQRGGPRGLNPRGSGGQSGGNGGGRNPAAMVRPTSILRRGGVGKPSLSLPPNNNLGEVNAFYDLETDQSIQSGRLVTFNYARNNTPAFKAGSTFQQDIEPAGRYISPVSKSATGAIPTLEYGQVTFNSPLVLEWGGYGETGWKKRLSDAFGGKKGKALSKAIAAAGYDGIITVSPTRGGQYATETVDLRMFKPATSKPSLSLPPGQASPEVAAWKTVDGRTWLTEAEAKSTGLMYYNIEPDEAGLNDQVTEDERRMLQRGKVLDIKAESVPLSQPAVTAEQDAEYLAAVEAGDMEKAQQMVDEAAKAAGFTGPKLQHWTNSESFNQFDPKREGSGQKHTYQVAGFWFNDSTGTRSPFGKNKIEVRLLLKKPKIYKSAENYFKALQKYLAEEDLKSGPIKFQADLIANGFDGVIIGPAKEWAGSQEWEFTNYVAFDPNQIKSADPVTRDESGNVIPLSERFDSTSQSILRVPPGAGVPTQITRSMRKQLLNRGYTKEQIYKMKPAEAHAILNPQTEAEQEPEPEEAGQTDADMEAFMAEQQAIAEEEAAAREDLRNDPDAIDAVQASGKMSGRNLSKQFEYPEARAVYQALAAARDQLGGPETVQLDKLREWAKQTFESDPEKYIQWASDMAEENKLLDVDEQAVLGQAFQFLTREARLTGDKNIRALLNKVGNYYLDTGTRLAQAMSARRDPLETPHERWTKALDIVFGPSESVRRQLRVLPTESGKARRIARLEEELAEARGSRRADVEAALKTARTQQTKEELLEQDDVKSEKIKQAVLSKLDVTEDDLMLAGTDRVALHSAILDLPAVKAGLDAYKGKDNDGYNIMRLAFRGFSDAHIAKALNLNQDDVGQFINDATNAIIRPAVAEQVKAGTGFGGLIKAGLAKFKKSVGLEAPPKTRPLQDWLTLIQGRKQTLNQVTTEVNRVMKYALQSAKARNSGKLMSKVINTPTGQRVRVFVPFDQDDMSNYYAFAREYTAAKSSAFDKVYEYWINWPLLSGPQTQVANITGNAAQVAWHYTGQRLAEATLNLAYRDPTAPQFREFKHVLKGFWQGIGPAFDMARQTFLTEGDTIRHKYLGEPMEIDVVNGDLDKVGNIRASVGGKLGRVNRLPGRVLRFTDAFFKTAIMYAEASAVAYRRAHAEAKAQGLTGKARSTFIDTEIANTINDTSSAVWGEVMKTAEELLFQDENMATEIVDTVLGGYKGIRDLEQKLAEAEAKGDYEQAAKLQKRIRSRKIVGSLMRWIFPFQRTPTNIVRVGIKKAGGSAISLLYGLTVAGWQSMGKNGVPMIKSYPKAMQIKDASETLLAGLGWLALASMLEGDDDDDKKKVLLVGTRSHSLKDRGATDQFLRKYGGENSIVWQDGNGKVLGTLPFGRYEPAATLLTTWIDAYRNYQEVKRLKSQGENALYTTYMMSSLVSSLEDKSFLQGFANAMQFVRDVEEKRESPDENAGSKMLMNNIIPNLIKQPLRNMDDVLRERTTAGPGYAALPNPAVAPKLPIFAAQPKISTTGERLTKAFTPPARLLFQANTKVTPQADALLYRANRLNPTKRWSPQPLNRDDYTADPPGKAKPLPITDPAKRRQFAELAGRLYAAKAAQVAAKAMPSEKSKPTPSIITAFKKAREDAMAAARAQAHAIGLHKPTSTP